MTVGSRNATTSNKKKLSQIALRKIAGISSNILGRCKRGERTPSVDIAKNIARALDVSLVNLAVAVPHY